jgi:cytidyltransferase-like protein
MILDNRMKNESPLFCFPGCFCPPTYGHLKIVETVAALFPEVTIINSTNAEKNNRWFSESECKSLWSHYTLPSNVRLTTFGELHKIAPSFSDIIMIRGIRGKDDLPHENDVLMRNYEHMGINKYFYIITDPSTATISSSRARAAAENLNLSELALCVAPGVATALLEKVLGAKNIIMVVGRPGGGKSTFLKAVADIDDESVHINTDDFNHALRPLLEEAFPGRDLIQVALDHEAELLKVISKEWFIMLSGALKNARGKKNIFVEIPYGMQPQKSMYRFIGNKVLYVGCNDDNELKARMVKRGTPELVAFLETIPDVSMTRRIAEKEKLLLDVVDTTGSLGDLTIKARQYLAKIETKETYHGL